MPPFLNVGSLFISIIALCASVGIFWVHYRNLLERRHGDVARIRADQMRKMSALRARVISCQTNIEILRLEIRKAPECAEKYEVVESIPNALSSCKDCLEALAKLEAHYCQLHAKSMKTSALLFLLQKSEVTFDSLEEKMRAQEQSVLNMLVKFQAAQGST
jgi:hypothetical protein